MSRSEIVTTVEVLNEADWQSLDLLASTGSVTEVRELARLVRLVAKQSESVFGILQSIAERGAIRIANDSQPEFNG